MPNVRLVKMCLPVELVQMIISFLDTDTLIDLLADDVMCQWVPSTALGRFKMDMDYLALLKLRMKGYPLALRPKKQLAILGTKFFWILGHKYLGSTECLDLLNCKKGKSCEFYNVTSWYKRHPEVFPALPVPYKMLILERNPKHRIIPNEFLLNMFYTYEPTEIVRRAYSISLYIRHMESFPSTELCFDKLIRHLFNNADDVYVVSLLCFLDSINTRYSYTKRIVNLLKNLKKTYKINSFHIYEFKTKFYRFGKQEIFYRKVSKIVYPKCLIE